MNALLAALAASLALALASTPPVRVAGLGAERCPGNAAVDMNVENASSATLLVSLSVERRDATGAWVEFAADVLADEPHPKQVVAVALQPTESRAIRWRPRVSGRGPALPEGSYRVVANWLVPERPPATRGVVAEFAVRAAAGCRN